MKITDALRGEHGVLYIWLDTLERQGEAGGASAVPLAEVVRTHAEIEDQVLFSALEAVLPPAGPLAVMRAEHQEIESTLDRLASREGDPESLLAHLAGLLRDHFAKEENVLFPLADAHLGDERLVQLGRQWAERRGVTLR